ncbi:GNAT family protein [Asanoa sp. NPDC049573]|uniref:GNAT family N-acetyltransferase n=1 Tax=Asanoa sp. NPDC049573 TaxID=3155396 RepID=UPI00343ADFF1
MPQPGDGVDLPGKDLSADGEQGAGVVVGGRSYGRHANCLTAPANRFTPGGTAAWLGGVTVDAAHQGKGFGRAAVSAALAEIDAPSFALSYQPDNTAARALYARLGFVETGELEDDEVVGRRPR